MTPLDRSTAPQSVTWNQALRVCPPDVQTRIGKLPLEVLDSIEELRFRQGQPLEICGTDFDRFLHRVDGLTDNPGEGFLVTNDHLTRVVQAVTQSSLYAVEDDLKRGFVTIPGGHRVGIAGRAILHESGQVRSLRNITSLNIRIAKERIGVSDRVMAYLVRGTDGTPYNTLVISPPQCGKTTLLRDLARQWSEGMGSGRRGLKVCIVDERSELAGCTEGVPQFRIGPRTDVLDACPKAEGMLMMIRSLSPDVIVTDEIGREQDRDAILEATHAGVSVLASAHARSLEEWKARPHMKELFVSRAFGRYVVLSRRRGPGTIDKILDADGLPLRLGDGSRKMEPL